LPRRFSANRLCAADMAFSPPFTATYIAIDTR
jgi:hypothetical protein